MNSAISTAWRVAIVVTPDCTEAELDVLVRNMPVWAIDIPAHRSLTPQLRAVADSFWAPEPAFATFTSFFPADPSAECLEILPTIEAHHSTLSSVVLPKFDTSNFPSLGLSVFGYEAAERNSEWGLTFKKPLSLIQNVRRFVLDAAQWQSRDDVYDAFFKAVGAPSWHGRNFDALNDSVMTGGINQSEVPYRLIIHNLRSVDAGVRKFGLEFAELMNSFGAEGCPVAVEISEP